MIVEQNDAVKNGKCYLNHPMVYLDRLAGIRKCLEQLRVEAAAAGLGWSAHFMEAAIQEIDTVPALGGKVQPYD